jgi:hypothetical protein
MVCIMNLHSTNGRLLTIVSSTPERDGKSKHNRVRDMLEIAKYREFLFSTLLMDAERDAQVRNSRDDAVFD